MTSRSIHSEHDPLAKTVSPGENEKRISCPGRVSEFTPYTLAKVPDGSLWVFFRNGESETGCWWFKADHWTQQECEILLRLLSMTFQVTKTAVCLGAALKNKTLFFFSEWADKDYLRGFLESASLPGKEKPVWLWQEMAFKFPTRGDYSIVVKPDLPKKEIDH